MELPKEIYQKILEYLQCDQYLSSIKNRLHYYQEVYPERVTLIRDLRREISQLYDRYDTMEEALLVKERKYTQLKITHTQLEDAFYQSIADRRFLRESNETCIQQLAETRLIIKKQEKELEILRKSRLY